MKNFLRILLDIIIVIVFGVVAYHLFGNIQDSIENTNPFYIALLIPFKLSAGVIHWFLFRKLVNYQVASRVDWKKSLKEANLNDIFAIVSFIMFVWFYGSFS